MASIPVTIKHTGKAYSLTLDASQPPRAFKETIYQSTGVPVDRMKVMIKGGTLKDDDWGKVVLREGLSFMVLGTAGELPKPPEKKTVFLEDMDDKELAEALALPVGLKNLGNTCYMNATVQALRAIPELQTALAGNSTGLPGQLGQLYASMSRTADAYVPHQFLSSLRQSFPQFAEFSRGGGSGIKQLMGAGYAQQDAEECYSQIVANALRDVPGPPGKKFIEAYMMSRLRNELRCDEAPDEPATVSTEDTLKVGCHISKDTNFMYLGIKEALDQNVTKHSPSLNRDASYSQRSRLERLPAYLTVHMVRFAWKADISKKVKIMRRVKFPAEYDALDIVTDELKAKLQPASRRLMEIEKDRMERRKVRKRMKIKASTSNAAGPSGSTPADEGAEMDVDKKPGDDLEEESVYRKKELEELEKLISPDVKADVGASPTGLYELIAIITHKGPAADAGHYIGFVKKSAFHPRASEDTGSEQKTIDDEDNDWYKFDDDKVSIFPEEKLATLEGGGEDASAYVLLYKTKPLA